MCKAVRRIQNRAIRISDKATRDLGIHELLRIDLRMAAREGVITGQAAPNLHRQCKVTFTGLLGSCIDHACSIACRGIGAGGSEQCDDAARVNALDRCNDVC